MTWLKSNNVISFLTVISYLYLLTLRQVSVFVKHNHGNMFVCIVNKQ